MVCVPKNIFEPVVAYEPLNDANWLILTSCAAFDADTLYALALNDVATEELKSPVTDATEADNDVILALLALKSLDTLCEKDCVNEFKFATDVFTLADVDSKLFNLPSCVSFVVLAADAELIKEPVIVAKSLF
jgi:hypothetical protein